MLLAPSVLRKPNLQNANGLVMGHLIINSLPGKFEQVKVVIQNNFDILISTKTKIESSFSSSQLMIEGFSIHFRFNRNRSGGGFLDFWTFLDETF